MAADELKDLTPQEAKRRTPWIPRATVPHIEVIIRLPSGEKAGLWSPWGARSQAMALVKKWLATPHAAPQEERDHG